MTPIERAARALHKDYVENRIRMGVKPEDLPAWEDLGPDGQLSFYAPARAVLTAIREPSEGMTKADVLSTVEIWNDERDGEREFKTEFGAAIDAALEEGV